ncbi:hypothetical protein BD310DRAFT_616435 [Dichomitus squalens]|uniref:Uncharacterized protein n=1 Tax=Dichomitus squalens TaxID=114155 RepID=A0A4Q9PPZ0_9APHY|nr:hypothetical protein BD310DRAFT_616435 [Dichomitus squalens]
MRRSSAAALPFNFSVLRSQPARVVTVALLLGTFIYLCRSVYTAREAASLSDSPARCQDHTPKIAIGPGIVHSHPGCGLCQLPAQ